jgi:hypothetical protein
MKQKALRCALAVCAAAAATAKGQDPEPSTKELLKELRRLNERVEILETRHESDQQKINEMEERLQKVETAQADHLAPAAELTGGAEQELEALLGTGTPQAKPSPETRAAFTLGSIGGPGQSFNPDISLNGDFVAAYSNREGGAVDDEFLLRELEIGFSGAVDPYTRADMIVTVGREDGEFKADLEEAYLTFLQLPYNLQARAGKFRAEFGRANPIHLHAVPWIDYPFVIRRYFGDEVLFGTGAELSWLIPNPWNQYMGLTYELFNNDNDTIFAGQEGDDFTHLLRFKTSRDLSPASTVDLGTSIATAPNDGGHGGHRATVGGVDLTYHWKPKGQGLYRSFLWQSEAYASHTETWHGGETAWGMYSAAEYQFARRWKLGLRYDNTELPNRSSRHERGYSTYLTYLQSEFLFWRLGYIYTDRNFEEDGNSDDQQVLLQLNWTLGAHPAHKF